MEAVRTDLIRISTYARNHGKSVQWAYLQAKEKKIKIVEIDGVKFVKVV